MGKILIEEKEITTSERFDPLNEEHVIDEKNNYIHRTVVQNEFKSSIFLYGEDEKVLISKATRFGKGYYKIVLFNDKLQKAWNIIELSMELEVKIKRVGKENFVIIGNNKGSKDVSSQVSFCKLKPSSKTEEITINFTSLNDIHFLDKNKVALSYSSIDAIDGRTEYVLAVYNNEGKLQQTLYEFFTDSDTAYYYKIIDNQIKVFKEKR